MRFFLPFFLIILMGNSVYAQSILEQFEDEANNATTFTTHGISFTLTGQLHIENFATLGVGPSLQYIDNSNYCPGSNAVGTQGTLYTTNKQNIFIDTIYIFPSINCVDHNTSGSIILNGYSAGSLVASSTTNSFTAPVYGTWQNGFTKLTMPFGSTAVDSIAFVTTGSLKYVAIDQLVFRKRDITWTGATSTSWNTTSNWNDNAIPGTRDNIIIPGSLSNYPNITSGTVSCRNITINSGGSITVNGGTLQISGIINAASTNSINATNGTIVLNDAGVSGYASLTTQSPSTISPSQQTFYGVDFTGNTVKNFVLNNTAGALLYTTLNITDTYTPTAGVFDGILGSSLTLKSSASGTARIAAGSSGGSYITSNFPIIVEQYIPGGRRAFRFLAHPFTSAIALTQLTDDINITGTGGATNGFTTTGANNPSSYWYNVSTGNGSTSNDPGWTAFTNTNGIGANSWDKAEGLRILVRGALGEGLTSGAYTPSAVTLDMSANGINQGNQTISLTKGSGTSFVLIGNPFPSQIDLNQTTSRTNVGSAFFVWNTNQGTKGAYQSNLFSASYILPAYASFVTTLTANGSITFPESCKSSTTPTSLFKTTAMPNMVELRIEDSTIFWDRVLLSFDDNALSMPDYNDAAKLLNPEINFNTYASGDSALSIDSRPYADGETIKLGLSSPYQKNFKIVVADFDMPAGTSLVLNDKYMNTKTTLQAGTEYWFAVSADTLSQGNNRFELNAIGKPNGINYTALPGDAMKMKIVPNPAHDIISVYYKSAYSNQVQIRVFDMMGKVVRKTGMTQLQNEKVDIPINELQNGLYIIELFDGKEIVQQKIIKQ